MNKRFAMLLLVVFLTALTGTFLMNRSLTVKASDHDDGETDIKTKNTNITDVYAMREKDIDPTADPTGANMILAMYVNPRSIARQQYFFNEHAFYTFHIGVVGPGHGAAGVIAQNAPGGGGVADLTSRGREDIRLKFQFSGQNAAKGTQNFAMTFVPVTTTLNAAGTPVTVTEGNPTTLLANGSVTTEIPGIGTGGNNNLTTPKFGTSATNNGVIAPIVNPVGANAVINNNGNMAVFAGLREDTFTFDVNQFFRVRAGLKGQGVAGTLFRAHTATAVGAIDFPKDFNVLAIVMRVPIAAINLGVAANTTFDVYATVDRFN